MNGGVKLLLLIHQVPFIILWAIFKPWHWNLGIGIGIGIRIGIRTDTTNVISSIRLWTPKLAGWEFSMWGPHPKSHETLRYFGHVANKKRYISTFTRPMDPKLSKMLS